jgi:hypothetical protein
VNFKQTWVLVWWVHQLGRRPSRRVLCACGEREPDCQSQQARMQHSHAHVVDRSAVRVVLGSGMQVISRCGTTARHVYILNRVCTAWVVCACFHCTCLQIHGQHNSEIVQLMRGAGGHVCEGVWCEACQVFVYSAEKARFAVRSQRKWVVNENLTEAF